MGHQQHVSGFVIVVVESKVVDLAKIGSCANNVGAMFEKIRAQCLNQGIYVCVIGARSDR